MNRYIRIGVGVGALVVVLALLVASYVSRPGEGTSRIVQQTVSGSPEAEASSAEVPRAQPRVADEGDVGDSVCIELAASPENSRRWLLSRQRSLTRAFFESLQDQGYGLLERQLVADLAGLDALFVTSRHMLTPDERADAAYPLAPADRGEVSLTKQRGFEQALNNVSLDQWFQEVENNPAVVRYWWTPTDTKDSLSELRPTSFLGHAIRRRGADLQENWHRLPAGSLGLHELSVAIEVGVRADRFIEALDHSNADPGETWYDYRLGRDVNLAVVSVFNARPAILQVLTARGVEPSSSDHSVLDEVADSPVIDRPPFADVVRHLARTNDQPFLPSTLQALSDRFPNTQLGLHPDSLDALAMAGAPIEDAARRLASISGEWQDQIAEAERVEERCRESWLAVVEVPTESLTGKIRYGEETGRRLDRVKNDVWGRVQLILEHADPAFLNTMELFAEAYSEQEWSEVLRLADEIVARFPDVSDLDAREIYDGLLYDALMSNVPMDVVRALINRNGGSLPPDAVMWLVAGGGDGSVAMAEELEQLYGLDIHFVDEYGRNAVNEAVERLFDAEAAMRWMDYLMSRSVTTKPSLLGLDPLDEVLLGILQDPLLVPERVRLAQILIENGAPIESSHRQVAEQIRSTHLDRFEMLVATIPTFTAS